MIDRELTNYAKSFTHIVPLTGSAGLLLLLQKASSADSIPAFQNSLRIARGTIHFEAIFGNTNISQCDSLMKLLAVAPASKKDILNRLRHKSHYIERMNQLITVLHALDLPDCKMTPSAILALLKEAAALIERVGMSLEASCFVLRQPNTEVKRKVLSVFLSLLLKQQQLFAAVFHNPTVLRLLPVLLSAALSAMNEGNGAQCVNERLGDESSLLWLTLANGSDCLKEKWNDSLSAYFVLLSIARIANAHSCCRTTQFLLFFSVQYFKPAGDNTADRVAMIESAVDQGYNVIVMPGYAFGAAIAETAPKFSDVKFIALDVSAGDLGEGFEVPANLYCAVYQEELCGYMAGYAAVKLGYKNLGFLGGMAVPAVQRYGYGFVQGVDAAAAELKLTDVKVNYAYGNQFFGDADITAAMDTWYAGGTEIVFACGGGIYTSAVDAAKKVEGAKVIGVDVDQAAVIANYAAGEGADAATVEGYKALTVTSAMKGLYPATFDTLTDVIVNGNWEKYSGKIDTLGLVSADDPAANYVQIPMESTQWADGKFTQDDYKTLVKAMFDGTLTVSNDITKAAKDFATVITVDDQGNIK